MLAELFDRIVTLGRRSDEVRFHAPSQAPDVLFVQHGDKLECRDIPGPRRFHALASLDSLVRAVQDKAIAPEPEVYFDGTAVRALLNRAHRWDTVALELSRSVRWETLRELRKVRRTLSPRDAVHLLRFDLHGTGVEQIITELGRVDFKRSSDGGHTVAHGRESLGKAVEASVQQADRVPETFSVSIAPFTTPGLRSLAGVVRCGIYIDVANEGFVIQPLADELEALEVDVQRQLEAALREALGEACPLFHGSP